MPRHDTKNQLPLELAVMLPFRAPGDEVEEEIEENRREEKCLFVSGCPQ